MQVIPTNRSTSSQPERRTGNRLAVHNSPATPEHFAVLPTKQRTRDFNFRSNNVVCAGLGAALAIVAAISVSGCKAKAPAAAATPIVAKAPGKPAPAAPPAARQLAPLPEGGVKALYMTGWSAGGKKKRAQCIGIIDRTVLNSVVIDVKDDGDITYMADVPLGREIRLKMDGNMKQIADIDKVIAEFQRHNIFPIARITCFRDKPLGNAHPEMAVHNRSGGVWHDRKGNAWLNPYCKAAWDYNVDLGLDALKHGFKEVQFDYVRFPTDGRMDEMVFPGEPKDGMHEDQIAAFLKYAHDKIHAAGGWFSADVFGLTSMVKNDEGIGQKFVKVVENVDYLCPMVYPSHYAHGEYHIPNPNAEPYKIITLSVGDAQKRLATVKTSCKLRPWIQDFSLGSPPYGPTQVKAEIKALEDLGIHEFLLWNARNNFHEAALGKQEGGPTVVADAAPATAKPADSAADASPSTAQNASTTAAPANNPRPAGNQTKP